MSRRRKGRDISGIVLLDKPAGYSSNQAVQKVRWLFQARKAGHTGALDPFATGMLPICLGEASKTAGFMLDADKSYEATAVLGRATATGDTEGETVRDEKVPDLSAGDIDAALARFTGEIRQVPPMYSALKHEGRPLYALAREGKTVQREARAITIHSLERLGWNSPELVFRVHCSKGTYVRTLAEDIGNDLGSCAHLRALRRLTVGPFSESGMQTLEDLEAKAESGALDDVLLPVDAGLVHWPEIRLDEIRETRFRHGNPVPVDERVSGQVRVYSESGRLLGLGEITAEETLKPRRLMHLPA